MSPPLELTPSVRYKFMNLFISFTAVVETNLEPSFQTARNLQFESVHSLNRSRLVSFVN